MDRQVAYDLFITGLEKRGIPGFEIKNIRKEVLPLVAWGAAKGRFANPHTVHDIVEWKKLGDDIRDAVLDEDKTAKKLGKVWKSVYQSLTQQILEKKAAKEAVEISKSNAGVLQEGEVLAPSTNTVILPSGSGAAAFSPLVPSAPPEPAAPPIMSASVPFAPPEPAAPQTALAPPALSAPAAGSVPSAPALSAPVSGSVPASVLSSATETVPAAEAAPATPPQQQAVSPQQQAVSQSATSAPVPGVQSNPWGEMARQSREAWATLARHGLESGDAEVLEVTTELACPVTYTPVVDQQGQIQGQLGNYSPLDWKLLAQLRQTVSQYGPTSEPVKQMLDYLFNAMLLLPNDLRGIAKLIYTPHQQLLFNAHWQAYVNESVATQRGPGDPLHGVTVEELMGIGLYIRTEAQATIGPDKVKEAMRLVRLAMRKIKDGTGIPMYMSIKQGRDESFGSFIDKVATAIEKAGVADYMKGALLKQCALQNSNESTKRIIFTLGANWTIEEALERLSSQPVGQQAFLVKAIQDLGVGLQKQAESVQSQVLAALAPLQAPVTANKTNQAAKCYRCGQHAQTQVAAASMMPPPVSNPPQQAAWDSTWLPQ